MLWSLMIISFVVLFGWTYCIPLEGECSRNPTQCEEGTICYQNSTWWSGCHKKCPDGWGCNAGSKDISIGNFVFAIFLFRNSLY